MKYVLLVFLGACSYGVLSTFVKLAYESGFHLDEVVGSQVLFGMLMMWAMALLYPRFAKAKAVANADPITSERKLKFSQVVKMMLVGSMSGLTGVFYYGSLQTIPASLAIVLLFQFTWIGVLLEAVVERRRPGNEKLAALSIIFSGIALTGGIGKNGLAHMSLLGLVLGLLSAFTYTLFIFFSGKVSANVPPMTRSAIIVSGSAFFSMCVYPPAFLFNGALLEGLFKWGFLLALFGAVIPTLFFTIGVPYIGGGLASILSASELPTAVLMSYAVLHEKITAGQWIGVAVILAGIVMPELLTRRKKPERPSSQ